MQLKDQAAIVTGGASGLGAATARRLAQAGAKVVCVDRDPALGEIFARPAGFAANLYDARASVDHGRRCNLQRAAVRRE